MTCQSRCKNLRHAGDDVLLLLTAATCSPVRLYFCFPSLRRHVQVLNATCAQIQAYQLSATLLCASHFLAGHVTGHSVKPSAWKAPPTLHKNDSKQNPHLIQGAYAHSLVAHVKYFALVPLCPNLSHVSDLVESVTVT